MSSTTSACTSASDSGLDGVDTSTADGHASSITPSPILPQSGAKAKIEPEDQERPIRFQPDPQQHRPLPPLLNYTPQQLMGYFAASHRNIFGSAVQALGNRLINASFRRAKTAAEYRTDLAAILCIMDRALSRTSYNLLQLLEDTDAKLEAMSREAGPEDLVFEYEESDRKEFPISSTKTLKMAKRKFEKEESPSSG